MSNNESGNNHGRPKYTTDEEELLTNLDPTLQDIVLSRRPGQLVDVVARLRNPARDVPGLRIVKKIGRIVTGMVNADQIEEVREHKNILSLKAARPLRKMLGDTVPEICASQDQLRAALPVGHPPVDGSDVIVGFVDQGCDFAHPNFRKLDSTRATRVRYLWDQRGGKTELSPKCYGYGREFTAEMIDAALLATAGGEPDAPHKELGYAIKPDAHGTAVMDVAVGNGGGANPPGVAPGSDIIFVEMPAEDAFEEGEQVFGNSRRLLEAVTYIFDKADEMKRPAVVNLSLNFDNGPHDGSTPLEECFDLLLEKPGRAIVIAAGNSRLRDIHLQTTIRPGQVSTIDWGIVEGDPTSNELEIWYDGRHRLRVTLRSPDGQTLGPFDPGTTHTIRDEKGVVGRVFNRLHDPGNRDNHIVLVFRPPISPGIWHIDLQAKGAKSTLVPFDVHAWIEKDILGGKRTTFENLGSGNHSYTVGSLGCGHSTIVVGGYQKLEPHLNVYASAEGPTRDGKLKPEVSAPTEGVMVAKSLSNGTRPAGGTSIAAPHVTGVIALLMEASQEDTRKLPTISETRDFVIQNARNNPPPDRNDWDSCFGAGRINAASSLKALVLASQPAQPLSGATEK